MREAVRNGARAVLTRTWKENERYCPPNPYVYPHLWLWDSCFHAIAWAELLDERAAQELDSCFEAQLEHGFVPHMHYSAPSINRGPLAASSTERGSRRELVARRPGGEGTAYGETAGLPFPPHNRPDLPRGNRPVSHHDIDVVTAEVAPQLP